jgi:protoporphyrinogen oxidase
MVGGGPAGLAAAFRLSQVGDVDVHLVERAPQLGGLAAGFQHGDFTLDYGPHRLHIATPPEVLADLQRMLGSDLRLQRRHGRIRLGGRFLPYPVGPATVLGLGPATIVRLLGGLIAAKRNAPRQAPDSYEAVLRARLGGPLYELFYGPYAEKVWGRSGTAIAADQADRRVNQRGLGDLVRLALGQGEGRSFWYPRGGFGRIPAGYVEALAKRPRVTIQTSANVERVAWADRRIEALTYSAGGVERTVSADHLVWSAPLPELVRRLDPALPDDVARRAAQLRHRAVVLVYLVLERTRVGTADTYYFPERHYPFNRVIEQKNFSAEMAPAHRTVLGMDIACDPDDATYDASDDRLRELVLGPLESTGLARRADVVEIFSRRFRSAYPLYDLDHSERFGRVRSWLDPIANLWLIGRQGLSLHNNTHHSLLMGYRAADAIRSDSRAGWSEQLAEFNQLRVAD